MASKQADDEADAIWGHLDGLLGASRNGGASDEPSPFGFFSEGFFSAGFFSPSPVEGSFLFLLEDLEDLVEVGIATTTEDLALDDGDDGQGARGGGQGDGDDPRAKRRCAGSDEVV